MTTRNACKLSKTVCQVLRHKDQHREAGGAVEWEKVCDAYCRENPGADISEWTTHDWIEQLMRGSDKPKFQYCLDSAGSLLYMRSIQGHSGRQNVDPTLRGDMVRQ